MAYHQAVRFLCSLVVAAAAGTSAEGPDPAALLNRVGANVMDNDARLQNYTCVETITRIYYRPAASTLNRSCSWLLSERDHPTPDMALRLNSMDRLRLDVAVSTRGEMFSWPGAGEFDDSYVDHVVREGPIGSGAFGAFLSVIFKTDARRFLSLGLANFQGRQLMKYSFEVLRKDSHYMVKLMTPERVPTAYRGLVLVDPGTADSVHLLVETAELPAASGSCQTVSNIDYARVTIGDRNLLLASHARQRFISRDGAETENTVTFSSCREYSSESTVSFYQRPDPGGAASAAAAAVQHVPPDLQLRMQLTAPIDTESAAVGDRFSARLTQDLRDGRRLLAPKGAIVEGRISSMKVYYGTHPEAIVGLSPRHIAAGGSMLALSAFPYVRRDPVRNGRRGVVIVLPPPGEHAGVFRQFGSHAVFPRGFASEWTTAFPPPR